MLCTLAVMLFSGINFYPAKGFSTVTVPILAPTGSVIAYGDSKTLAETFPALIAAAQPSLNFDTVTGIEDGVIARNGATVASMKALVDADLAAIAPDLRIQYILFNLGVNETASLPAEATWLSNANYILNAFQIKWPGVQVYLMRPWARGEDADCDTVAGWIATLVASRANAHLGPDERVWMEGGDDGATMTDDGIHPNAAGNIECAAQWLAVLGY